MRQLVHHQAIVALAALVMFLTGLGASRLWDDDESKNATCAREMWQRGDLVVPTFNGQLRTDKPPLTYWLMMASYSALGPTEFAARLPSALMAVSTALLVYHVGRMLFRPEVGLWAGLILTTNVLFTVGARAATPDASLVLTTVLAMTLYVGAMAGWRSGAFSLGLAAPCGVNPFSRALPRRDGWLLAVYAALGLAVLAKGPIGVAAPVACIGLFALLECSRLRGGVAQPEHGTLVNHVKRNLTVAARRAGRMLVDLPRAALAMRPLLLVLAVLLIAGPWYMAVGLRTDGRWLSGFFWRHNVERFLTPLEGHGGSVLFHIELLAACFFPWCLLLPAGLALVSKRLHTADGQAPAYRLVLVWISVWLAIFSLAGTKLPSYLLPAYPSLALTSAVWVADWVRAPVRRAAFRWLSAGWFALAASGVALTVVLTVMAARWAPEQKGLGLIGVIPVVGAAFGYYFHRRGQAAASIGAQVAMTMALLLTVYTLVLPPISERQDGPGLAAALRRFTGRTVAVGRFQIRQPGVVFYSGATIGDLKNPSDVQRLFAEAPEPLLITNDDGYQAVKALLPPDAVVIARRKQFPEKLGDMLVVVREAGPTEPEPHQLDEVATRPTGVTIKR